jgi:hypothetical protein
MKTPTHPSPRYLPLAIALFTVIFLCTGCVSNRYKAAKKSTPPPEMLNVAFAAAPVEAALTMLITYNGPGSWKRDAFWDEYVVTLHNPGNESLTITAATLVDYAGTAVPAGDKPWDLEKASKTQEQKYKETGMAFVRHTGATVTILGAGAAGVATAGVFSASAPLIAGATVAFLPLYALAVVSINHDNRKIVELHFNQRRIRLPLTLAPGETRTGSCFFPMVPSPRSLSLHWSTGPASGDSALSLDFLHGLHLKAPTPPVPPPLSAPTGG